ncbi:MAG: right-handed parallel beta-helix repeat-containing protein [Verrucomicrobiota bacterium JB022]|nr:right-handed parallel beta-helix repeat-containing protein [Verrucomicrobiota bacterium JB022]
MHPFSNPPPRRHHPRLFAPLLATFAFVSLVAAGEDVTKLGLSGDGTSDNTEALQALLRDGPSSLYFPDGSYLLGTVEVPADRKLEFSPEAEIVVNPEKITEKNLFVVTGDNVQFEGLHYDFAWNGAGMEETPVHNLVYAEDVESLTVSQFEVVNSDERGLVPLEKRARRGRLLNMDGTDPKANYSHIKYYNAQRIILAKSSRDIILEDSGASRLHAMIEAIHCANVTVRGNHMVSGNAMTMFQEGGETLRHHDNWSRDVKYQVVWFGGSPDPNRKPKEVPQGTSRVVYRDIKHDDPAYNRHTSGAFDVIVQNNYAEYGNTLAWGNKARQVVIDNNIARFISDYAYGTEGGENIVFSNNISINSTAGGIVSMYWGEKLLITGNLILVRHEDWSPEWSWWDQAGKYLGPFVRLHHGPYSEQDPYGAGTVHISSNLFVNELSGRSTPLTIQASRDITISDNKFINGRVDKFGAGSVSVLNNEFVSRLGFDDLAISVRGEVEKAIIRGNTIHKQAALAAASTAEQEAEQTSVPYLLFTEEDAPVREGAEDQITKAKEAKRGLPAISLQPQGEFFGLVEDNAVIGWDASISVEMPSKPGANIIVTDNTVDGEVSGPKQKNFKALNNLDISGN